MKHLQKQWAGYSAEIAKDKAKTQSHEAELERLRQLQLELGEELSELEVTIDEAQKERASRLRAGLRETASTFAERSASYATLESGDLFEATKIQSDKEAITFYEKAQTELMKRALQQPYEQALRNQEERERATSLGPIDAGVVLHQKGEQKLDIYLTAFTGSTGGLVNNLAKAVRDAVKSIGASFTDSNVEDLLRIAVEGDYRGLVQELEKIKPEGFKEAQVEYRVVVLGEDTKPVGERKKRERTTSLHHEEAIPVDKVPDNYIAFDKASEILGIAPQNCYNYVKSGRLTSKKYELSDKTKVRAVEIESLKALCAKRGKNFPEEITDTYSASTVAPALESIVADLPEESAVSKELTEEPQPKSLASRILGEQIFAQYSSSYGPEEVEKVVTQVISCLGDERAKVLFAADVKGQLFKEPNRLLQYLGRLNVLLSNLQEKYGANIPSEYQFESKPSIFLPNNFSAIERKLEEAPVSSQPALSDEMALKMDINPALANRLTAEGYNPAYVHAMIKGGFGIGNSKQYVGEAYFPREYWRGRTKRALSSLGIKSMDEDEFSRHEKVFRQLKLFNEKNKQEHPLAFSPKWSDNTSGALKDYLASVFYPKR